MTLALVAAAPGEERLTADFDFRLRHVWLNAEDAPTSSETRLRLDAEAAARVSDTVTTIVGLGLHREGAPVAAEVPLGEDVADKPIAVRRAEIAWRPEIAPGLTLLAGKIAPPWARASDLVWDEDVRPEGGAARWVRQFGAFDAMAVAGAFILRDDVFENDDHQASLYAVQTAIRHRWRDRSYALAGLGAYPADSRPPFAERPYRGSVETPSLEGSPPAVEIRRRSVEAFVAGTWELYFPLHGVVHYVFNPEAESEREGWLVGLTVGRTAAINSLEFGWQWCRRESNAVLTEFTDDTVWTGAGRTEHRFRVDYRAGAGVLLGAMWSEGRRWDSRGDTRGTESLRGTVFEVRIEF